MISQDIFLMFLFAPLFAFWIFILVRLFSHLSK